MVCPVVKRSFIKAIKFEAILILLTTLAALFVGGHFAAVVALAVHLPTSLLTILVINNVSVNTYQEAWFYIVGGVTVAMHILFLTMIMKYRKKLQNVGVPKSH